MKEHFTHFKFQWGSVHYKAKWQMPTHNFVKQNFEFVYILNPKPS